MNWKKKTFIVVTMVLMYGVDATVMAQEQTATQISTIEESEDKDQKQLDHTRYLLEQGKQLGAWELNHINSVINRLYGHHESDISSWKKQYEYIVKVFKSDDTHWLLRPIAELCAAYQAAGDFVSAVSYLRHGEDLLQKYQEEVLKSHGDDIPFFRTVVLFNRIGQGLITPDEAKKEAVELLENDKWLTYYKWCELELLDIVDAAENNPAAFPEKVAELRCREYSFQYTEHWPKKAECIIRAARTYNSVLGQGKRAERMLDSLYQEMEKYNHTRTQQEMQIMMVVLKEKSILSSDMGRHPDTVAMVELATELYERTSFKSQIMQDTLIDAYISTYMSYAKMGKLKKWSNDLGRLVKNTSSESNSVILAKAMLILVQDKSNEEEKRQACLDFQTAMEKRYGDKYHKTIQIFSDILPDSVASDLRPQQDALEDKDIRSSGKTPYMSRIKSLLKADKALANQEYLEAILLYEQVLALSRTAGAEYGDVAIFATRGLAKSNYLAGYKANEEGNKDQAIPLIERGLDYYVKLIDIHEKCREEINGLDERREWFSNVVDDYREAEWAFHFCPRESKKYIYYMKKIFDTIEKCKARTLLEHYAEQIAETNDILSEMEVARLQDYRHEIQNRREEILRLEKEQIDRVAEESEALHNARKEKERCEKVERQYHEMLREKYPAYRELSNPTILDSREARKQVPPNTAFFEYSFRKTPSGSSYDTVFLELLSLTDANMGVLINEHPIYEKEWTAYNKLLSYPNFEQFSERYTLWKVEAQNNVAAHYEVQNNKENKDWPLHSYAVKDQQGFDEARKELAENWGKLFDSNFSEHLGIRHGMRIIISPDDSVPLIPFETLTCDGKSFAELYEISYVPSFSVYALMRERGKTNAALTDRKELFAMGNAIYGNTNDADLVKSRGNNFEELPYTAEELRQVGGLFLEGEKTIFQRENASESRLKDFDREGKLGQYKYLLFAAHGIFDSDNPMDSAVVLSQPDKRKPAASDGYVTVGEWMGYHLHSDLVFLSACETGRGTKFAGEGLIGLPYALTIAGNKSTIMTLWEIEEKPAAAFAEAFFGRLKDGLVAIQALVETKREFLHHKIESYRNPHVWGAYQLYGE